MKTAHSKGIWEYSEEGDADQFGVLITKEGRRNWLMAIHQNGELSLQEQKANMELLVASPKLLEIVIKLTTLDEEKYPEIAEWLVEARKLVAIDVKSVQKTR